MQDNYIGDIGDYGKYGLLRTVCSASISLSVNWYKVISTKSGKQEDGKYTNYLTLPQLYREYDPRLFDSLRTIVHVDKDRRIKRIEKENLLLAKFFSDAVGKDRLLWHQNALQQTEGTDAVFLDPDNGLETLSMYNRDTATEKHVKWTELRDYYLRGQSVILYQHRPQMTRKEMCIEGIVRFQKEFLMADSLKILEFPKYTNRFYFMFLHEKHKTVFENICSRMAQEWGKAGFCREIIISGGV